MSKERIEEIRKLDSNLEHIGFGEELDQELIDELVEVCGFTLEKAKDLVEKMALNHIVEARDELEKKIDASLDAKASKCCQRA